MKSYDLSDLFDLCIIGSGPAGIILALEYAELNPEKKILIVEFGEKGKGENRLDDSIQLNNLVNHYRPYESTNKGFGGTSATWGGRCVMYDEVDFTQRPILNGHCTWGEELFKDLQKYLVAAAKYFECGKPEFNIKNIGKTKLKNIAENFVEGDVTDSVLERWSTPTRFGKRYRRQINSKKNITLLSGFEARDFSVPDENGQVTTLIARKTGSTDTIQIKASTFVVAAGAQESTRLLLRNSRIFKNLAVSPAALGKYYQGHLSGKIASVKFTGSPKKTDFGFIRDSQGIYLRRRFQFSKDVLEKENLLNTAIWLDNPLYYDPGHRSGAMSGMYLIMLIPFLRKKLAPPALIHSITNGKVENIKGHLLNIVRDLPLSLIIPAKIFFKRYLPRRKLPGVFLFSPENRYALHFHAEQIPCERNNMTLGTDGETLQISYALSNDEINSVIKLHSVLDDWLRKCNCGYLEYWYKKDELIEAIRGMSKDGIHQCGTTRIASSPSEGVVDANLRVWGTKNVFVCSSSVFPTSGQANPTFFLGAFAVRLAHHLTNNQNEKN